MKRDINNIVLAYSGGLETSVILAWLIETCQCPVICFAADVGQGRKSEKSLYHSGFATFEEDEVHNRKDAEGFIRLSALRLKIATLMGRK